MMIFVVLILFLICAQLTTVLKVAQIGEVFLNLGLPEYANRSKFNEYRRCKFIEAIRPKFIKDEYHHKYGFVTKKLICGSTNYTTHLLGEMGTSVRLGAVEYNRTGNTINIWINTQIFHSAAVAINMAHNLYLKLVVNNLL